MFAVIKKSQIIMIAVVLCVVVCSSIVLSSTTAKEIDTIPSLGITVVVDAGHGGVDPGGIGINTKVKESDLNLEIAFKLSAYLKNMGINVVMTRTNANGLYGLYSSDYKKRDMQKRKEMIEKHNPDIVVSVHMNRYILSSLRGAQAFYDKNNEQGKKLAESIQHYFHETLASSKSEVSIGDYFMLKCSGVASVIAECGFLSNPEDEALLVTNEYQEKVAYAIFCGIVRYLSLEE